MAMRGLSKLRATVFQEPKSWLQQVRSFAAAASVETEAAKKKHRKKKNFIEVAQFLPEWGIGSKFTKSHWPEGNFYRITNVKVYKSGRHGAAWGIFHKDQVPKSGDPEKIGGVNKRCWRYVPEGEAASVVWKRTMARPERHAAPPVSTDVVSEPATAG